MKHSLLTKITGFLSLMLVLNLLTGCGKPYNASTEFWVRGNCDMCKATIEKAVNATDGVANASYDVDAHQLHVDYDSTKVNLAGLHAACASAGYETKNTPAIQAAYADLPVCCKKPEDQ
jgi:periplasmic mercuric ion binding protein